MSDVQRPPQLPQSGSSLQNIGTAFLRHTTVPFLTWVVLASSSRLDSRAMDNNIGPEMAPPVPHIFVPAEPQGGGSANQAPRVPEVTSRPLSRGSSGTSRALSAMPSGHEGGRILSATPPINVPASNRNEGANEVHDEIFLKDVVPKKGPMTGEIDIAILARTSLTSHSTWGLGIIGFVQ
jgi:hypothetical protein